MASKWCDQISSIHSIVPYDGPDPAPPESGLSQYSCVCPFQHSASFGPSTSPGTSPGVVLAKEPARNIDPGIQTCLRIVIKLGPCLSFDEGKEPWVDFQLLLWMDEIHFAPPKKPWNDLIPCKYPQTLWFQPWSQLVVRNGFRPFTVWPRPASQARTFGDPLAARHLKDTWINRGGFSLPAPECLGLAN